MWISNGVFPIKTAKGWGDDLVGKLFAAQAWEPEVGPQDACQRAWL